MSLVDIYGNSVYHYICLNELCLGMDIENKENINLVAIAIRPFIVMGGILLDPCCGNGNFAIPIPVAMGCLQIMFWPISFGPMLLLTLIPSLTRQPIAFF